MSIGVDVWFAKVVQDLMRHASSRFTRGLYPGADRSEAADATAAGANNSLRRTRCIGTRDPRLQRCRDSVIATVHGAIWVDRLLPRNQGLILRPPTAQCRGQVLRNNAAEKP